MNNVGPFQRRVTLSFDNGPTPGVTERVLDSLAERNIKATFFIVGKDLRDRRRRAIAQRAVAEGHWVGNHTMTHSVQLGDAPPEVAHFEIEAAQRVLSDLARPEKLFRPYGGGGIISRHLLSAAAVDELRRRQYTVVLWNSLPRDWEDPKGWPERCLQDIQTRDWSLVVVHDTPTEAMLRLPYFLAALSSQGVTVVQDFPEACVPIRSGVVQGSIDDLTS